LSWRAWRVKWQAKFECPRKRYCDRGHHILKIFLTLFLSLMRAVPAVLSMWPCKNISHIQVQLFTFFQHLSQTKEKGICWYVQCNKQGENPERQLHKHHMYTIQLDLVPYWFVMDRLASSSRSIALLVNYSRSQPVPHNNTCVILWRQLTWSQQLHNLHFVQSCSSTEMM
jgi:hypothetical protein